MAAEPALRLERTFECTPEELWAAWTEPEQYAKWLNPAPGLDLVIHEFDVRPGGRMRFDMPQPDGSANPQEGVFHELERPRRIVSGAEDKSFLLEATFEPVGEGRTRLVVDVTGVPPEYHDMATVGWNQGLDKLTAVLAGAPERTLVVSRAFDAPPERVFEAWTEADVIGRWWGPNGFTTTTDAFDFRQGGRWRFVMHGPDGTDYPNLVTYREIVPNVRIVYDHGENEQHPDGFRNTVTFAREGAGTRVTLRLRFPTVEDREKTVEFGAVEGGQQTLARLAEHVEGSGRA